MENIFATNSNQERAWVVILISDKINFMSKKIAKDQDITLIEGPIHQENIIIINIYVINFPALKCIKQTDKI